MVDGAVTRACCGAVGGVGGGAGGGAGGGVGGGAGAQACCGAVGGVGDGAGARPGCGAGGGVGAAREPWAKETLVKSTKVGKVLANRDGRCSGDGGTISNLTCFVGTQICSSDRSVSVSECIMKSFFASPILSCTSLYLALNSCFLIRDSFRLLAVAIFLSAFSSNSAFLHFNSNYSTQSLALDEEAMLETDNISR